MLSLLKMLLLGSAAWSFYVSAETGMTPFVHEKIYMLPSGKKVAVTFRQRACTSGECPEADAGMWGIDGGTPRFITDTFLVTIGGREFVIPEKFYKDITNTRSLDVFEQDGRVAIELKGGDAAGAYTARFTLGGMCGFERQVCGEVCEEIWEHSTWYNSFAYGWDAQCKSGIR